MKYFFTLTLLFIGHLVFSQEGKIIGKIVDAKTNKPVKGAHIIVVETTKGTVSNASGYFELTEKMPLTIVISHVSYQTSQTELTADKATVKIVIKPLKYSLEKVMLKDKIHFDGFIYDQVWYDSTIKQKKNINDSTGFAIVESECDFPGGMAAFNSYLIGQLIKKRDSLTDAFSSEIAFTVTSEGMVAIDSISGVSGKQAATIRQIYSSSPKWIPARQREDKVAIHFTQAIEYDPKVEVFQKVDQGPEFPGGFAAFYKLIGTNLKFPSQARKACIKGKVFVQFVINQTGEIEDISILKGLGYGCDEEVIRVIKLSSGKWIPGKTDGKPVKVRMSVPVSFDASK